MLQKLLNKPIILKVQTPQSLPTAIIKGKRPPVNNMFKGLRERRMELIN